MDDTQKKDGLETGRDSEEELTGGTPAEQQAEQPLEEMPLPDNVAPLSDELQDEDSAFPDNQADGYASQFGELEMEPGTAAAAVQTKKKSFLMPSIIIAIVILFVAAAAGASYLVFFHNTPAGVWAPADGSGSSYYVFDNSGTAELVTGTVRYKGTYSLSDTDGGKKMNLYIPVGYSAIQGDFDYKLSGSVFTGKTFEISSGEGDALKLVSSSLPENTLTPAKDRKTDDKIIGTWKLKDSTNNVTYTINQDGTIILQSDSMRIDGVYTIKDKALAITYNMAGQESTMEEEYSFDGETLLINSMGYEKAD